MVTQTDITKDFLVREFLVKEDMGKSLLEALAPHTASPIIKPTDSQTEQRNRVLADIAVSHLKKIDGCLETIRDMESGRIKAVLFKGIKDQKQDLSQSLFIPGKSIVSAVSHGVGSFAKHNLSDTRILQRSGRQFHERTTPPYAKPHTDGFGLSVLYCPVNIEQAATLLIDMEAINREMGDLANQLMFEQGRKTVSLAEMLKYGQQIDMGFQVSHAHSSPEAYRLYEHLLPFHSQEVTLEHDQFLMFRNGQGGVVHAACRGRAAPGEVPMDSATTRVLVFEAGHEINID